MTTGSFVTNYVYRNDTGQPQVVWVEPWARDYMVFTGQSLRIGAYGEDAVPQFEFHHLMNGVELWCDSTVDIEVFVDGVPVECGHNRISKA